MKAKKSTRGCGLSLNRRPCATVVVINNGGGGIFSFLPVADQIDPGSFTKLFATPPDVSRRGLCEAHRVAHSHPSTPEALRLALEAAWGEGRHSVVEVTTSRARNLEQHRALQKRVAAAAACALKLREKVAYVPPRVSSARVSRFSLPMLRKPTTLPAAQGEEGETTSGAEASASASTSASESESESEATAAAGTREGWLLRVELEGGGVGWGEASPLPGLHRESAAEAGAQLRAVASLLDGGSSASNAGQSRGVKAGSQSSTRSFIHVSSSSHFTPPPPFTRLFRYQLQASHHQSPTAPTGSYTHPARLIWLKSSTAI